MVDNIVTKPLELMLIVAAHMIFNVPSQAEVTGIVGTNISLQFTFNVSLTEKSHFGVYVTDQRKIAEYTQGKERGIFDIYPINSSVFWHIKNLKLNDSGSYWATLFKGSGLPQQSNKVQLTVRVKDRSSTVPPMQSTVPPSEDSGSSSVIVTVLVVSPAVLLTVFLTCLIWCLVRTKDEQQQPPQQQQQSSNPTVKERAETSEDVPASSLIYSVLDFPKRPLEDLKANPSDTEYAAVSPMQSVISQRR